jgi:uncharacterized protein GlcG (DUF336 family)
VRFIGDSAILLNKLRPIAVVGGNEVTNPIVVNGRVIGALGLSGAKAAEDAALAASVVASR